VVVRFGDRKLERLEADAGYSAGFGWDIVKAFRKRMQFIRAAASERDFYAAKLLHFEKLSGAMAGQHSMRLNDQFRLVLRIEKEPTKVVVIVELVDYH